MARDPWMPARPSIYRVQVCRDGPCPDEPLAPCDAGPQAQRSPDGFHCYVGQDIPHGRGDAELECTLSTSRLASIQTEGENQLVASLAEVPSWIGLVRTVTGDFVWSSGEPSLLAPPWDMDFPMPALGDSTMISDAAMWRNGDGSIARASVCEREELPRWRP